MPCCNNFVLHRANSLIVWGRTRITTRISHHAPLSSIHQWKWRDCAMGVNLEIIPTFTRSTDNSPCIRTSHSEKKSSIFWLHAVNRWHGENVTSARRKEMRLSTTLSFARYGPSDEIAFEGYVSLLSQRVRVYHKGMRRAMISVRACKKRRESTQKHATLRFGTLLRTCQNG